SYSTISSLATDSRLITLARPFLPGTPIPFRATLFEKTPTSNWLVAWHQDTALPFRTRHHTPGWGPWSMKAGLHHAHAPAWALDRVVALRVHLDESTGENGPLRVVPYSHTLGRLSDEAIAEQVRKRAHHSCCVPQGAILVMKPLLIHASSKS